MSSVPSVWKHFRPRREPRLEVIDSRPLLPWGPWACIRISDGVLYTMMPVDPEIAHDAELHEFALEEFHERWLQIIRARTPAMRQAYRLRSRKRARRRRKRS